MIRSIATWTIAAALGIALGVASALYLAGLWPGMKPLDFGDVEIDGWRSDFAIGSEAADIYTRARVARHGLLALAKSEAVYFTRTTDNEGKKLREECIYSIAGGPMPAQWWSITLYDADSLLPMNEDQALSFDATRAGDGAWEAKVSRTQSSTDANWISSRNSGTFDLMLRLYVPDDEVLADPEATFAPPKVERLDCKRPS